MGEQEGVKDANEVDEPLLVGTFLNVNQILNPAASLLENTVYQEEGIGDQLVVAVDNPDDLKEQSDVILSFVALNRC